MPHLALLAMSGFRARESEMLKLGMTLPALARRAQAIGALPSLGLLTLAGMTPSHWSVSLHEAPSPCEAASCDAIVHQVCAQRPTLVAMSALTASILDAYVLAGLLRAQGLQVVMGGLHVSMCPDEAKRNATSIVIGEGEPVWHDVLRDAEHGQLCSEYKAQKPFNLADAPMPRLDLLNKAAPPRYTLQTARGCPFACDFCGASRLLGPFREKPVERVRDELAAITSVSPRAHIELADDNTFAGRRDAAALLDAFHASNVRWFTECDWRVGERPEILARLAESGCVQLLIGVEALELSAFSGMGAKRAPLSRVMDALHNIQCAGIAVIGCFVVGTDNDDEQQLQLLGEWLLEAPLADVQLTVQTPFPGTALRTRLAREGRLLADRGWESCTLFDVAYQPAKMSVKTLERGFRNLVSMVFAPQVATKRDAIRERVWRARYGVYELDQSIQTSEGVSE